MLWFCLAALVPIAAAALVTREVLSSEYRRGAAARREHSEELLNRSLRRLQGEVERRVATLATRDTPYAGGTLLNLQKYGGTLDALERQRIRGQGRADMLANDYDVLFLLDQDGRVLDSPHYPSEDEVLAELLEVARHTSGESFFRLEPVMEGRSPKRILVAESAKQLRDGGYSVTVMVGKRVDSELLDMVRQEDAVDERIVDKDGEVLSGSATPWPTGVEPFVVPLRGAAGGDVARIELHVADELEGLLQRVTVYTAGLAAVALVCTLILGYFVARRMTGDLDNLVVGAQAAAHGDLDHQVPVRARDEIGAVGKAFNTMMLDLKESKERLVMAERVAAWQEIARRLAHEIKNPLTPIQMSMETLRKTFAKKHPSFDEVFEEATSTVLEEASRLKRIVGEFSEFARMPKPEKRSLDLNDLVSGQLSLYQGSLELRLQLGDDVPVISADRDSIAQLLLNLVENARDAQASSEGSAIVEVTTKVTREGKAVSLIVDDAGPGIEPSVKEKLFTPYFTTKHATGGTGLGLAICHRIVSDHEGKIVASDSPLGGARFTVEFPAEGVGEDALMASVTGQRSAHETRDSRGAGT